MTKRLLGVALLLFGIFLACAAFFQTEILRVNDGQLVHARKDWFNSEQTLYSIPVEDITSLRMAERSVRNSPRYDYCIEIQSGSTSHTLWDIRFRKKPQAQEAIDALQNAFNSPEADQLITSMRRHRSFLGPAIMFSVIGLILACGLARKQTN